MLSHYIFIGFRKKSDSIREYSWVKIMSFARCLKVFCNISFTEIKIEMRKKPNMCFFLFILFSVSSVLKKGEKESGEQWLLRIALTFLCILFWARHWTERSSRSTSFVQPYLPLFIYCSIYFTQIFVFYHISSFFIGFSPNWVKRSMIGKGRGRYMFSCLLFWQLNPRFPDKSDQELVNCDKLLIAEGNLKKISLWNFSSAVFCNSTKIFQSFSNSRLFQIGANPYLLYSVWYYKKWYNTQKFVVIHYGWLNIYFKEMVASTIKKCLVKIE